MSVTYIQILGGTEVKLWGLTGKQRLVRMLAVHEGIELIESATSAPARAPLVILLADFLFDPRLLGPLLKLADEAALLSSNSKLIAAVRTETDRAEGIAEELLGRRDLELVTQLPLLKPENLTQAYDSRLLKYDPPEILRIEAVSKSELENELFNGSYKGVTDFITKWLWPVPARHAVNFCVHHSINANQVTVLSLVLAILAGLAFWQGYLGTGLLLGWIMTFLDTVDGKLARVTVTSSKVGDVLDHGLDLIHPPLWYLAWAAGIAGTWMSPALVTPMFWIILIAYVGGRLCEGAFDLWIAPFRLFLWQSLDSYNRLVTARRNPNMVILSLSLVSGRPDIGLYVVAVWHIISTLFLAFRLFMAWKARQHGPLESWLNTIDPLRDRDRLEVRLFTRLSKTAVTD